MARNIVAIEFPLSHVARYWRPVISGTLNRDHRKRQSGNSIATMLRACKISTSSEAASDSITLNETDRHRRRMMMRSDNGVEFLLDLPSAQLLRHGEKLVLDDGRTIDGDCACRACRSGDPDPSGIGDRCVLVQLGWRVGSVCHRQASVPVCQPIAYSIVGETVGLARDLRAAL